MLWKPDMEAGLVVLAGNPVYLPAITRGAGATAATAMSGDTSKFLGFITDASYYVSGTAIVSFHLAIIFQPG